jgi:LysM repeat protein
MTRHWGTLLLLSLTLTVAGCVRTAGTPYEPVTLDTGTAAAVQPTATTLPATDPTDAATPLDASAQGENTTPTDIPITVIPPTETLLPSLQVTETPTDIPPTVTVVPPTATLPPTEDTTGAQTDTTEPTATVALPTTEAMTANADETPLPGQPTGPSGPVEIATNTPIPSPTPAAPASDLQPTPTDFGDTDADTADATADEDECTYTVRAGDNAFRIAVNNNITLNQLREANPGQLLGADPIIQPGDVLEIPGCGQGTVTRTPQPTATAAQETVEADETPQAEETGDTPPTPPEGFVAYEIRSGDTLIAIARRYGTTVNDLVEVNDLTNPDVLDAGDVLFVPDPNATD